MNAPPLSDDDLVGLFCAQWNRAPKDLAAALRPIYNAGRLGSKLSAVVHASAHQRHQRRRARRALPSRLSKVRRISLVLEAYARARNIDPSDITAQDRRRVITRQRYEAMWLARQLPECPSFPEIGLAFGRDHTIAMRAFLKTEARVKRDPRLERELLSIARQVAPNVREPAPRLAAVA